MRTVLLALGLCLSSMFLPAGLAQAASDPVYTGFFSNVAVGGYDTVAYFTENKPVKGDSRFSTSYKGAQWHFASQANRDRFIADPERYAPQYGGYCAWAVSEGDTASSDPTLWKIVDGKLYLNYDAGVQKKWEQDIAGHIRKADGNWPGVLGR
ncbi:YHS domain-containing protein [Comamonadaceae bacterium G21597-S1]|nr:YHS domain-containing protein [Comamonadaceae bacterium G21597-S1]